MQGTRMSMSGPGMTGSGLAKAAMMGFQVDSDAARIVGAGLRKQTQSPPT